MLIGGAEPSKLRVYFTWLRSEAERQLTWGLNDPGSRPAASMGKVLNFGINHTPASCSSLFS